VQTELVGDLSGVHGVGQILLVGVNSPPDWQCAVGSSACRVLL
jgi:hypothetical protein